MCDLLSAVTKTLSSAYSILIVTIYLVIVINRFTHLTPENHHHVEPWYPLFIYLLLVSCLFLIYLLLFLTKPPRAHQNRKSHGSAFLRQGAVIFGVGSLLYFIFDLMVHVLNINCSGEEGTIRIAIEILIICLFSLQIATIVTYPRLNLDPGHGVPHFGLMHLVATNVVIWIRTVIKESMMEFEELKEEDGLTEVEHGHGDMETSSEEKGSCDEKLFVSQLLKASTPILFAFIIEFALIGATVFYNMWNHVQPHEQADTAYDQLSYKPNIKEFILRKTNWKNSLYGGLAGIFILLLNIISLAVFLHFSSDESNFDEYIEKSMRIISNTTGIIAILMGFWYLQKMTRKEKEEDIGVDQFLLNLGAGFTFVYMSLSVSVGIFHQDKEGFPAGLIITNGVLSVTQVILQLVFIHLIINLVNKPEDDSHPGRQFTTFLVLLNFTLWLVNTFELQKNQASAVESAVYGVYVWVWLQRLTLPLVIFFRFHSTVVLIDCWKNSYRPEE